MFEIIPSPGTTDKEFEGIEKKLNAIIPPARTIHIDIADGKFVNNTTLSDPAPFAKFTKGPSEGFTRDDTENKRAIFEVHLMVEEPINYLKSFAEAGFTRFIGQIEKMSDQAEFVAKAQELGEAALAIDLDTQIGDIKVPFRDLDSLLIMSVKAGHSGQAFSPDALEKIRNLKDQIEIPIEIDGGINDQTILEAYEAGANRFVATSYLFGSDDPKKQYQILNEKLKVTVG